MVRSVLLVLGVMAVAGWPALAAPFQGDEALFALVAHDLAGGAVLYRDHWDITNPGIFGFYTLAGSLFGFTEDGIRLFEWLWVTGFVLTVSEAIRRTYGLARLPVAPAVLVGGVYFAAGYSGHSVLTKTEGLVGFPLFLAVWLAARVTEPGVRTARLAAAAGVVGGVGVLFKLLFVTCLAAAWGVLLVVHLRRHGLRSVLTFVAGLIGGCAAVVGAAVGVFAAQGTLPDVIHTLFELPPQFLAEGYKPGFDRLAVSVRWFLGLYSPVLAAAVLGGACRWREARDPFVPASAVLIAVSAGLVVVQRLSWWPYHLLLVGTPAAVLAAYGWPAVGRLLIGRERAALAVAASFLFLPHAAIFGYQYLRLAKHRFGLTAADRQAVRAEAPSYREAAVEAAFLAEPGAKPGPILVCGDPLIHWLSGRPPATAINGWSMELYPAVVRDRLAEQVRQAKPVYVYVERKRYGYDGLIREKYPTLAAILAADYAPVRDTGAGTWYERRPNR